MPQRKLAELVDCVADADLLVIGGGLAGGTAANVARDVGIERVVLADKGRMARTGQSTFAAGIWALPLPGDELSIWIEETIRSGEYICDHEWVKLLWERCYDISMKIKAWGEEFGHQVFELDGSGGILRRRSRGHQQTGHATMHSIPIMETLRKRAIRRKVQLLERVMLNELIVREGRCMGALGYDYRNGQRVLIRSAATIIASAGCAFRGGFLGERNITGDLQAAALRAGVILRNMEIWNSNTGSRDHDIHGLSLFVGSGGKWYNNRDEEFMPKYDPVLGNRANEQVKCLALAREVHEGRGPIHFDLTAVKPEDQALLRKVLPETFRKWDRAGIDPFKQRIPWMTAFLGTVESGGGIDINTKCETNVRGLYGAGDVTCEPPHGGYAFSGVNIAFAVVSGNEAATHAKEYIASAENADWDDPRLLGLVESLTNKMMEPLGRGDGVRADDVVYHLQKTIVPYRVAFIKNETTLLEALAEVERLRDEESGNIAAPDLHELVKAQEAKNMVEIAEAMLRCALVRKESRSFHFREDYPITDNGNWLKWVYIQRANGELKVWTQDIPSLFDHIKPPLELMRPPGLRKL